jgi:hypothetical protein
VTPRHNESPESGRALAGQRQNGGQLSASLRTNQRGRRVFVNAAEISTQLVDLSVADAREFAWQLLALTAEDAG